MKKILIFTKAVLLMTIFFWSTTTLADDKVDKILDLLKKKGIITEEECQAVKQEIEEEGKNDLIAVFDKRFKLRTRDKKFELGIGGRLQFDFRGYDSGHPEDNEFDVRRIRVFLEGRLYEHFKFKTQWELEGGKSNRLRDGYMEYDYFKNAKIRLGQFKEPFSMETLTSSKYIFFLERSLNSALSPSRDLGVMIHGNPFGNRLHYAIGIFNGNGVDANGEDNDDKEVALRLVLSPFIKTDSIFKEFHIGGSFTYGHEDEETVSARSEARTKYFEFKDIDTDTRTRLGGEVNWMLGPFTLNAEYIRAKYEDLEGEADAPSLYRAILGSSKVRMEDSANIDSWYITTSYCLTGEKRSYKKRTFSNITPKHNFDPTKGTWGAWEVAFRYSRFDADNDFFQSGIVKSDYTKEADSFNLAINWFLNPSVMIKTNYVHTDFDHGLVKRGKKVDNEDVFLMRFQLIY